MSEVIGRRRVRAADLRNGDAAAVGRLVGDYLRRTEQEKAIHLALGTSDDDLPPHYRPEVDDPQAAYAGAEVHLAEIGSAVAGVVVLLPTAERMEVERLWADPGFRGRGVGSALLDTAIERTRGPLRLSVWAWRERAIRLYESRGFVLVPSWDPRPSLVCMERAG